MTLSSLLTPYCQVRALQLTDLEIPTVNWIDGSILFKPCFWKQYVDDVCAAVNSSLVQTLRHHLNNIEPSIQFTVEREKNRKISFLDVTVCRQDNGRLSTKV